MLATGFTVPLQIQCSACGHQGTVPDHYVGKEVQCPKCQCLLVPLTADKMENYAAKVLFAAQARSEEVIREEAPGPEIPFACPFCGEAYQVSEDLAGKKITCRNCREACKVDKRKEKKARKRKTGYPSNLVWIYILLSLVFLMIGLFLGRLFKS
jgi:hypothetical protein